MTNWCNDVIKSVSFKLKKNIASNTNDNLLLYNLLIICNTNLGLIQS